MRRLTVSAALGLIVINGCGGESDPTAEGASGPAPLTAATIGEQTILSPSEYLAREPYATADRERGRRQAQICMACHSLEAGGATMVGPNLHGFFGRKAGAGDGFAYSAAIRDADFVWTPRALDAWLQQPSRFLPGNRMAFAGVGNADDRAALIAYLLEATGDGTAD